MRLSAGLSVKPAHFEAAESSHADGLWFEVHAENYMVEGGPRATCLDRLRARHPLSLHGVGMSLGAVDEPDPRHLQRLRHLCDRLAPALVSEHLAWSSWEGRYIPDLLPLPRTAEALTCVTRNVAIAQDALGREIAIENPSHYLHIPDHAMSEVEFLSALVRATGCGLLIDVNNLYVSASNLGFDAAAALDAIPADAVREIHLAGHRPDPEQGPQLLIDTHDCAIDPSVWILFERLVARIGPRPTLIERDDNLPEFAVLMHERDAAAAVLAAHRRLHARREIAA